MPGPKILRGYDVLIEHSRIVQISKSKTKTNFSAYRAIEGKGKYLIPGLFDMHVHLESTSFFPLFLLNGITAIREMGNPKEGIFRLKEQANAGRILAPHMFVCGPILEGDPPFWPDFRIVRTKKEGQRAVKNLKAKGADFIKVYHTLKPEVYREIIQEAKRQKLNVAGHLPQAIDIAEALRFGQRELEHMDDLRQYLGKITMEDAKRKGYQGWKVFKAWKIDKRNLEKTVRLLQSNQAFACPTLVLDEKMSQLSRYEKLRRSTEASFLPKRYPDIDWNPNHPKSAENIRGLPPLWFQNLKVIHEDSKKLIPLLAKHAILLAGSDTPNPFVVPGFSLIKELQLLTDTGLKPYQALEAATYNAARFFDELDEFGTVEEGKTANLVLLKDNPLKNISAIRNSTGVFLNGSYYLRSALASKCPSKHQ